MGILVTFVYEKSRHRGILVDTSALIDGRLVEIVNLGFISEKLIIPKLVEAEIAKLALSNDARIAAKAKAAKKHLADLLSQEKPVIIKNFGTFKTPSLPVDDELIALAVKHRLSIISTDYELLSNAKKKDVNALNINALALALRVNVKPGQIVAVKLLFHGRLPAQAVGYLEDGTMVVVSGGAKYIGKNKAVIIKKVLQTNSGRTVIARI